ncbi:Uncharacterised protein [Cedecea neteri]|uniref:Uncharacterized protein n=1 Tax=Cedecea neteri TaxID=158822 RepID=A0A291E5Q1_9ENTR|nr:hypothetical protein [Cedecea neteri]ATF95381.1 hypothetical protein CO704_25135 [Cedecea neteri]SQC91965.1 Uncharacterised protein [Cedecea neteri]
MAAGPLKEPMNIWAFLSQGWPYIGALSVVCLTHVLARHREKWAIQEKIHLEQKKTDREQAEELCFIGSQLIFMLESFAVSCADVAIDKGKKEESDDRRAQVVIIPGTEIPEISLTRVEGNWRVLRAWDMFRIMALPGMLLDARTHIVNRSEHLSWGADSAELLRIRAYYSTLLGLRASSLARQLRKQCGFPPSSLSEGRHSATLVLLKERKRQVKQGLSERTEPAM